MYSIERAGVDTRLPGGGQRAERAARLGVREE